MTIKTQHLSIRKYTTINKINVPGVYITFPAFFKKVTNLQAKTLISYTFENNILRLTLEEDNTKPNALRVNKANSIFISKPKCEEINLLNIPTKTQHVKFVVRNNELVLDLSKFKSIVKDFNEIKAKKAALQPSFKYFDNYNEENNDKNNNKKKLA